MGVDAVSLGDAGEGLSAAVEVHGVAGLVVTEASWVSGDDVAVEVGGHGGSMDAVAGGEFVDAGSSSVGVGERCDAGWRQRFQLRDEARLRIGCRVPEVHEALEQQFRPFDVVGIVSQQVPSWDANPNRPPPCQLPAVDVKAQVTGQVACVGVPLVSGSAAVVWPARSGASGTAPRKVG